MKLHTGFLNMDDLHCMRREGKRNKKTIAESGTAFPGPEQEQEQE